MVYFISSVTNKACSSWHRLCKSEKSTLCTLRVHLHSFGTIQQPLSSKSKKGESSQQRGKNGKVNSASDVEQRNKNEQKLQLRELRQQCCYRHHNTDLAFFIVRDDSHSVLSPGKIEPVFIYIFF